jgi:hypothetical protein
MEELSRIPNPPMKRKVLFFAAGALFAFLMAAYKKEFRWRSWSLTTGGKPMPLWLGRTWYIVIGLWFTGLAILEQFPGIQLAHYPKLIRRLVR